MMRGAPLDAPVLFVGFFQSRVEGLLRALRYGRIRGDWRRANDVQTLRNALLTFSPRVAVFDHSNGTSSLDALRVVRDLLPHVPLIVMADNPGGDLSLSALSEGAADVIGRDPRLLAAVVRRVVAESDDHATRALVQRRLGTQVRSRARCGRPPCVAVTAG